MPKKCITSELVISPKTRVVSDETRKKMSDAHKGKKRGKEFSEKMSQATKGELNGFYGKKHTEETKKKMSDSKKGIKVEKRRKCNAEEREEIRRLYQNGEPSKKIINQFGISSTTFYRYISE